MGYSELIQEKAQDRGVVAFSADLEVIRATGKQLLDLTNQYLSVSESEFCQASLSQLNFHLSRIIGQVLCYVEVLQSRARTLEFEDFVEDFRKIGVAAKNLLQISSQEATILQSGPGEQHRVAEVNANWAAESLGDRPISRNDGPVPSSSRTDQATILVVEDDGDMRELLCRRLEREGHTAATAINGRQGLDMIRSGSYDLILLDVMMPEMDGRRVLETLKSDEILSHLPVIMLTAMEDLDSAVQCIEQGAEDYLTKPVNSVLLAAKMRSCLEKKRLRDQEVLHLRKMESYSGDLEKNVEARVKELKASNEKLELQIVERKLAERRLNQLSRQNELILNSAGDGIFGLDLDGNIAFVNPAAIRMLGSSREGLLGRPWRAIARHPHPKGSKDAEYQCHLTATNLQEQSIHSTCDVFRRVDRTSFPVEYVATAFIEDGDAKGAVVVFRDITEQRKAAEQRDAEVERAVRIQSGLLPETLPELNGYGFHALCMPAHDVGGDFYDWHISEDGRLLHFLICDVMGKGVPAALLMAMVRATLRSTKFPEGPLIALQQVESTIGGDLVRAESFVTLIYCQLELQSGELRYVDAGHGLALVARADGSFDKLGTHNPPLGLEIGHSFQEGQLSLQEGDSLLLFTDGLMEGCSRAFKDPSAELAGLHRCATAQCLAQRLVELTRPAGPLEDDLTLLVVRRNPPGL
jgi:PAS domain S-box-containing protein